MFHAQSNHSADEVIQWVMDFKPNSGYISSRNAREYWGIFNLPRNNVFFLKIYQRVTEEMGDDLAETHLRALSDELNHAYSNLFTLPNADFEARLVQSRVTADLGKDLAELEAERNRVGNSLEEQNHRLQAEVARAQAELAELEAQNGALAEKKAALEETVKAIDKEYGGKDLKRLAELKKDRPASVRVWIPKTKFSALEAENKALQDEIDALTLQQAKKEPEKVTPKPVEEPPTQNAAKSAVPALDKDKINSFLAETYKLERYCDESLKVLDQLDASAPHAHQTYATMLATITRGITSLAPILDAVPARDVKLNAGSLHFSYSAKEMNELVAECLKSSEGAVLEAMAACAQKLKKGQDPKSREVIIDDALGVIFNKLSKTVKKMNGMDAKTLSVDKLANLIAYCRQYDADKEEKLEDIFFDYIFPLISCQTFVQVRGLAGEKRQQLMDLKIGESLRGLKRFKGEDSLISDQQFNDPAKLQQFLDKLIDTQLESIADPQDLIDYIKEVKNRINQQGVAKYLSAPQAVVKAKKNK